MSLQEKCELGGDNRELRNVGAGVLTRAITRAVTVPVPFILSSIRADFGPRGICFCAFPRFRILPGNIHRVVQVQKQSFPAIQKSEAKEIIVDKRGQRPQNNVDHAEAAMSFRARCLRAEGGVAVHVIDVIGERRVRMVNERTS